MVRQPHRLRGHKYEQTRGDSEGQGSLACCSPWGCNELNTTQQLNNKNNKFPQKRVRKFWKSLFPLKTRGFVYHDVDGIMRRRRQIVVSSICYFLSGNKDLSQRRNRFMFQHQELLGGNSSQVFCISGSLVTDLLTSFCSRLSFQRCLYGGWPWMIQCLA